MGSIEEQIQKHLNIHDRLKKFHRIVIKYHHRHRQHHHRRQQIIIIIIKKYL